MKNQKDIQKELQELSPLLAKLKAQEQKPEVPENYFESLPNQIWEQIKLQPAPERVAPQPGMWERLLRQLQMLLQPRIAVSLATFVILIAVGIYWLQPNAPASSVTGSEGLTAEEITDYINANLAQFDTELLMEATADLSSQSILPESDFSEEEIDVMMEEILKDVDTKTLEDLF